MNTDKVIASTRATIDAFASLVATHKTLARRLKTKRYQFINELPDFGNNTVGALVECEGAYIVIKCPRERQAYIDNLIKNGWTPQTTDKRFFNKGEATFGVYA